MTAPVQGTTQAAHPQPTRWWPLAIAALGVVFGDIGTSPLYAVKQCFAGTHALPVTRENVLGILSLFFWSLFMVVAVKYLVFIMRADNKGEGGLFALLALIPRDGRPAASGDATASQLAEDPELAGGRPGIGGRLKVAVV